MQQVLIADDEPIERVVISRIIRKNYGEQLEILQAENGREAVGMFEESGCGTVILDIEMPGINGLEAAEEIRKRSKTCSIIFLTAFDTFSYAKRAISVRALDYLLKPCAPEELIAVLDEAIRLAEENEERIREAPEKTETYRMDGEKSKDPHSGTAQNLILDFIQSHYMQDISLQDAAGALNYSDAYFCKLFKQYFDKNFTAYIAEFRVEKAKKLLSDVTVNIKEISERVGYRDSNYFTKVFKRIAGMTPSEYRLEKLGKQ